MAGQFDAHTDGMATEAGTLEAQSAVLGGLGRSVQDAASEAAAGTCGGDLATALAGLATEAAARAQALERLTAATSQDVRTSAEHYLSSDRAAVSAIVGADTHLPQRYRSGEHQ